MAIAASARLEARVTPALQELIKRAAELQGRSLTDFMVTALQAAAQRTIEESEVIRLSLADQRTTRAGTPTTSEYGGTSMPSGRA